MRNIDSQAVMRVITWYCFDLCMITNKEILFFSLPHCYFALVDALPRPYQIVITLITPSLHLQWFKKVKNFLSVQMDV